MCITWSRIAALNGCTSSALIDMKKLLLEVGVPNFTFQQPVRLPVYTYPHQHLSSFLMFASLLDVKWYPRVFLACFLIKYFEFLFCQTLCKAVEVLPKEETWLPCSRRERWALPACEWQRCTEEGAACRLLAFVVAVQQFVWSWRSLTLVLKDERAFSDGTWKLKDIPGGEEGTRQRHKRCKTSHSENWLSVHDCGESQDWAAEGEEKLWTLGQAEGAEHCLHSQASVRVLSRVLNRRFFLSLKRIFCILKVNLVFAFNFSFRLISLAFCLLLPFETDDSDIFPPNWNWSFAFQNRNIFVA